MDHLASATAAGLVHLSMQVTPDNVHQVAGVLDAAADRPEAGMLHAPRGGRVPGAVRDASGPVGENRLPLIVPVCSPAVLTTARAAPRPAAPPPSTPAPSTTSPFPPPDRAPYPWAR